MNPLEQIRTPQGRYPVKLAECSKGSLSERQAIRFTFESPDGHAFYTGKAEPALASIDELAFLSDASNKIDHVTVERLALKAGPLFGPNKEERLLDWVAESYLAGAVIDIQAVINSSEPDEVRFAPLGNDSATPVAKSKLVLPGGNTFQLLSLTLNIDRASAKVLFSGNIEFPLVKRYVSQNGYDYAFIGFGKDEQGEFLAVDLLTFGREISPSDYVAACSHFASSLFDFGHGGEGGLEQQGRLEDFRSSLIKQAREFGIEVDAAAKRTAKLDGRLEGIPVSFDKSDAPHLQTLVHAVTSLSLNGVRLDFFRSEESDGFLVFPNHVSYLWYRFMCQLGQVKIARCEVCGRGFSLLKGRGKPRKYCSDQCKNEAKNAREKEKKDLVRSLFLAEGRSVSSIAENVFGSVELEGKVRKLLREYPVLKHRLDDDLHAGTGGTFVRRCIAEGVFSASEIAARAEKLGVVP